MQIIGLTGGIASGKSTVSAMFKQHGIPVICADELNHQLQQPGTDEYHKIIHEFGESILSHGLIDRKLLAKQLVDSPEKLNKLEEILRPKVQQEIMIEVNQLKKQGKPIIVIDNPLLYTSPLQKICTIKVACICPENIRKQRAFSARENMSEEKWQFIIKNQPTDKEYEEWADYIINTRLPLDEVNEEVIALIENILN